MPLDGSFYVTDVLNDAEKYLHKYGWCVGQRHKMSGEVCMLGALDAVTGEQVTATHPAVLYLVAVIPEAFLTCLGGSDSLSGADYKVALFNNVQDSIEPIEQWISRAKELASSSAVLGLV
jgi:hypothetical protein